MALLSVIRRWHLRDGMAIREIARRTGLSRNTIRKYLSTGIVEPKYPERQSPSKLDRFAPKLAAWLKTESKKNRKQRRNLRQLYADDMSKCPKRHFMRQMTQNLTKSGAEVALDNVGS